MSFKFFEDFRVHKFMVHGSGIRVFRVFRVFRVLGFLSFEVLTIFSFVVKFNLVDIYVNHDEKTRTLQNKL